MDEFYGGREGSLTDWVHKEALPLVDQLRTQNFPLYEKRGLPMLLLFLDLSAAHPPDAAGGVGGHSGGLANDDLLVEFREAAKEHGDTLAYVYLDGTQHQDQMRALGLFGGAERLPAVRRRPQRLPALQQGHACRRSKYGAGAFCASVRICASVATHRGAGTWPA